MCASSSAKDTGRGECGSPRRCAAYRVLRIATPACGLVRNDKFGKCGAHRYLLPASALFGAIFLLLVDNISRNLLATEIPIGILTAFVGAPFFLYLMTRKEHLL